MYGEMMNHYGLIKDFSKADYFETEAYTKTLQSIKIAIRSGGMIALTGVVGAGKTTALRKIQQEIRDENKILVSKSLTTDKKRVNINTLYTALFSDLETEKGFKIPTQPERRERKLQELIKKLKKPIVMFVDEAHELHWKTLIGIKHLIETVEDGHGILAVAMVGHPKLSNELKKPAFEEIGARTKVFNLDFINIHRHQYIEWVLNNCSASKVKPYDIFTKEAIGLFSDRLVTPLQITHYLSSALEKGFQIGEKPIGAEVAKEILSPDINSIEPKLARNGYHITALCELLNARRSEVVAYLRGQLAAGKAEEFNKEILKIGII